MIPSFHHSFFSHLPLADLIHHPVLIFFYSPFPIIIFNMSSASLSTAPSADFNYSAPDFIVQTISHLAFSPGIFLLFSTTFSSRTPSTFFELPPTSEEQQQKAESVPSSSPSVPRPEMVEDFTAISQQLFQSLSHHSAPERFVIKIDGKDEPSPHPCQVTSTD